LCLFSRKKTLKLYAEILLFVQKFYSVKNSSSQWGERPLFGPFESATENNYCNNYYYYVHSATDNATVTVTVFVADVNDHAPTFPHDVVQLTVSEAAPPDARLSLLPATDHDIGTNAVQVCVTYNRTLYTSVHPSDILLSVSILASL